MKTETNIKQGKLLVQSVRQAVENVPDGVKLATQFGFVVPMQGTKSEILSALASLERALGAFSDNTAAVVQCPVAPAIERHPQHNEIEERIAQTAYESFKKVASLGEKELVVPRDR